MLKLHSKLVIYDTSESLLRNLNRADVRHSKILPVGLRFDNR